MTNLEPGDRPFLKYSIQIIRIEKTLYEELKSCSGFLGRVGQIYQNGFDLIKEEGRKVIHFRAGEWLHSPFGAILDLPVRKWMGEVSLKEGDLFWKEGQSLIRKSRNGCSIELDPCHIVNLRRTLFSSPPGSNTLLSSILILMEEILKSGKFEGMAGTCLLLKNQCADILSDFPSLSLWSRHALPQVKRLIESALSEDLALFEEVWERLLGLGPGLTPAGDDFLVGFLASHKLLSSSFGRKLDDDYRKRRLREKAQSKTNRIAFQFLDDALEGIFSETLYLVFDSLASEGEQGNPEKREREEIEYFLRWGHSSGADTLTGAAFGLWTMI